MRGIVRLILVLAVLASAMAFASDDPVVFAQGDDTWVVTRGSHAGYMGVHTQDVTKDRLTALNLKEETGVEVTMVDQDAPAGKAGIKEHDVILSLNGQRVESREQLTRMVRELPPGRTVHVGLSRAGQPVNVTMTLADRAKIVTRYSDLDKIAVPPIPPMPPMPPMADMDIPNVVIVQNSTTRTGMVVESLTPQLAEFFGVKGNDGGLLVRSVEKGGIAEGAGVKAGDVIVKLDQERISDLGDWRHAMRAKSGTVPLTIIRDKREQTLNLKLPERKRSAKGDKDVELNFENFEFNFDTDALQQQIALLRPQVEQRAKAMSDWAKSPEWKKFQEQMEKNAEKMMKSFSEFDEQ